MGYSVNTQRNLNHKLIAAALTTIAVLMTGACQPKTETDTGPEPVIQSEVIPVAEPAPAAEAILQPQAKLPDGSIITLELASTPEERRQGLMFRPSMAADRGMLFVFNREGLPGIWMKNTLIPLDLLYLNKRGEIVDIIENAEPCKVEDCPTYKPTKPAVAVLEVAAGVVEAHNLKAGDVLIFSRVPDYPSAV